MWQSIALRITNSASDADEAVQQALLSAWTNRKQFAGRAKVQSWVCRITINKSYNILRKRTRDAARAGEYLRLHQTAAPSPAVEMVTLATARLPELYRETMTMFIACNLDHTLAAQLLDCPIKTFYSRLNKAKKLLKAQLERDNERRRV